MRKPVLNIAILLLAIILIAGCKKNDFSTSNQVILFQYDHTRGINHQGYIIDSEGNIFTYNVDGNILPDNELEISKGKADEYLSNCEFTGMKIEQVELIKYAKYIDYIASSKVTAVRDKRENTGTISYICYQFDENSKLYRGHIIKMEGDNTSENLNFHSRKVSSWMREIGKEL
jgi:hypothetical protein